MGKCAVLLLAVLILLAAMPEGYVPVTRQDRGMAMHSCGLKTVMPTLPAALQL